MPPYFSSIVSFIILAHWGRKYVFVSDKPKIYFTTSLSECFSIMLEHNSWHSLKIHFVQNKSFYIFPSFTELHFLWHIRLGHQGIGEYNPSADLQTLCESQCSAINISLYFTSPSSFLAISAWWKKPKNKLTIRARGSTVNTVIAVVFYCWNSSLEW